MKKVLMLALLLTVFLSIKSQDLVSQYYIQKVFFLKTPRGTGTTFLGKYKNKLYLVTAKHMFSSNGTQQMSIFAKGAWEMIPGKVYFHSNPVIDIAVVVTKATGDVGDAIELSPDSVGVVTMSDTGFFLGFPYGFKTDDNTNINRGFPFPLIKKATYSAQIDDSGIQLILLDGFNNPGFSGGPVFFKDRTKTNQPSWKLDLISVLNGYFPQSDTIDTKSQLGVLKYSENSGIIISTPMRYISQIIDQIK